MLNTDLTVSWVFRSRLPAQVPPHPDYPFGIAVDISQGGRTCTVALQYPAPGVGTWAILCNICGHVTTVTAAGRADDPTQLTMSCKRGAVGDA